MAIELDTPQMRHIEFGEILSHVVFNNNDLTN